MSVEQHVDTIIKTGAIGGAGSLGLGVIGQFDWIAIIGVVVLVLTYLTNRKYRQREDARKQERHTIEMEKERLELQRLRNELQ